MTFTYSAQTTYWAQVIGTLKEAANLSKRYALVMVAVFACLSVLSTPVSADPPERHSTTVQGFETFNCESGVVLTEPSTYTESYRHFFKDGELIRTVGQAFFDGVVTNHATGAQFRDSNHWSFEIDWLGNTVTYRGVLFQLHSLDGGPVLLLDAGNITWELNTGDVIRQSAKHPATSPNLFDRKHYTEVLCRAVGA